MKYMTKEKSIKYMKKIKNVNVYDKYESIINVVSSIIVLPIAIPLGIIYWFGFSLFDKEDKYIFGKKNIDD